MLNLKIPSQNMNKENNWRAEEIKKQDYQETEETQTNMPLRSGLEPGI